MSIHLRYTDHMSVSVIGVSSIIKYFLRKMKISLKCISKFQQETSLDVKTSTHSVHYRSDHRRNSLYSIEIAIVLNLVWWFMLAISTLWRWRQKNCEFEASMGCIARPSLKKNFKYHIFPKNKKNRVPTSCCQSTKHSVWKGTYRVNI
jgi:hypothetical protein